MGARPGPGDENGRDGASCPARPWGWIRQVRPRLARSGTEAAVGPPGRHVRRLVEEPEALPLVADHPEVLGVDEQLLGPSGAVGRVVRQGDRGTALAQNGEG